MNGLPVALGGVGGSVSGSSAVDADEDELALLELLGLADRLVDGGDDHVLEHLDVLGVDRVGVDRQRVEPQVAGHHDLDHPPAGARVDLLLLELLVDGAA